MDLTVLYNLTYGLYVLGAFEDGRAVGCVVNTCFQVTSENPSVVVSLNKNNYTLEAIRENGRFSLSILAEDSDPMLIGRFGFVSSRDNDKYESFGYDVVGFTPCVKGKFCGRLILKVLQTVDCGTHMLVVAAVEDTVPGSGKPMTYSYYHNVIKGKAPKNAPTYRAEDDAKATAGNMAKKHHFECDICHYVVETEEEELPSDYVCPVCGADVSHFRKID